MTGENPGLWIMGPGSATDEQQVDTFLEQGGHVLRLDRPGVQGTWSGLRKLPDWEELAGLKVGDLRPRLDVEVGLLEGAVLSRREKGEGVELSFQLRPDLFDEQPYLRYSRWNSTRAFSRLISNLGGGFHRDTQLLAKEANPYLPVAMPSKWRYGVEKQIPTVASLENVPKDTGNTKLEAGWHKPDFDDSDWVLAPVLGGWERTVEAFETFDGAMWMRVRFMIPAEWKGEGDAILELPKVDDFDITYVNGFRVGKTGPEVGNAWNHPRVYPVRSWMLKPGEENTLAIRIFDHFGGGGLTGNEILLYRIRLQNPPVRPGLYHGDYLRDRALGDSPFRYYRW